MSRTHASEMFQSSCTSWSSKIIVLGTVESSQRMSGIAPGLAVEPRVLLEVGDLVSAAASTSRRRAHEGARLERGLVGVDLVAEQEQAVGPLLPTRLQAARERPERVDAEALRVLGRGSVYGARSGSPTRHEPKIRRACRSCSRVWIVLGGPPVVRRPDALAVEVRPRRAAREPCSSSSSTTSA